MKKGSFVKWPGGVGQIGVDMAAGADRTVVQLYRATGGLYEPTRTNISVAVDKLAETDPLPTAAGFGQLWSLLKRSVLVNRDVAIYAMLYEASEQIYQRGYYVMDYYTDGGAMYAIARSDGEPTKLYQFSISMSGTDVTVGEPSEVQQSFAPITRTKTWIRRNATGQRTWFSIASTATINRVDEIDSMELYDSFEEYAERTKEMPYLTVWHCREALRCGVSTLVHRDETLYINAGVFDDTKWGNSVADAMERHPGKYGVSIGFEITEDPVIEVIEGRSIPIFRKGRHIETSILPEDSAASRMTSINVLRGINDMNDPKYRESILDLAGGDADFAKEMLDFADSKKREIKDKKLHTREVDAEVAAPADIEIDEAAFSAALVAAFEKSPVIAALNAKLDKAISGQEEISRALKAAAALDGRLREIEKTEDEKIEKVVADLPRQARKATFRPSQAAAQRETANTIVKKQANLADVSNAMLEKMGVDY